MFSMSEIAYLLFVIFSIGVVGYLIGHITIHGVNLGTVGVFVAALLFGHFGVDIPSGVTNVGLIIFISGVGLSAGPSFIASLKKNGLKYSTLCLFTIGMGAAVCVFIVTVFGVRPELTVGMMSGAYTTTPGMSAAREVVSASIDATTYVVTGYGIIYPLAALIKVLFMQIWPKAIHADMEKERKLIQLDRDIISDTAKQKVNNLITVDPQGIFCLALASIVGVFVGSFAIPLPHGAVFALGITGGPLIVSLLMGHFGHIGPISLHVDKSILDPIKEIGLFLFYVGVGTQGGHSIVRIISENGMMLVFIGLLLVFIPLLSGAIVGTRILKLPLLNCLACNAGSMTFTPAMAALAEKSKCDDVAAAYASTYPLALLTLVLTCQILVTVL
jgi:putative transport protein